MLHPENLEQMFESRMAWNKGYKDHLYTTICATYAGSVRTNELSHPRNTSSTLWLPLTSETLRKKKIKLWHNFWCMFDFAHYGLHIAC